MALYIKDPTVGLMVEQNRARLGVRTKTDAVRIRFSTNWTAWRKRFRRAKRWPPCGNRRATGSDRPFTASI